MLIEYLVDTFGMVLAARYGEGDHVDHAQLLWPEGSGGIMLGSYQPGAQWCREPGTAGGYIVTADPAALYERVLARGADVIRPLAQTSLDRRSVESPGRLQPDQRRRALPLAGGLVGQG